MKKFILIGLLCVSTTVSAQPIDNIAQDAEEGKLTVSGTLPSDGEYTVQVLEAEKDTEDIDDLSISNAKDIIKTMVIFETDTPQYSVDVVLGKNAVNGSYLVRINGGDMVEPFEYKLEKYYNVEQIKELFNLLKEGDGGEILEILKVEENRDILGLSVGEVFKNLPDSEKNKLAEILKADMEKIDSVEGLREIFNDLCVALGISNAKTGAEAVDLIIKYGKYAGFDQFDKYEELLNMKNGQESVGKRLIGQDVEDKEKRKKLFNEAVILAMLENAEGTADFKEKMEENKEFFDGNLNGYFNRTDTTSVDSKIIDEISNIKTLSELSKKIKEIIEKPSSKPSGSGGGGGGYSGGISSVTVSTNVAETAKVESFKDMDTVSWAKNAVDYLYSKSVVKGKSEGLFYPNDYVKREEFVKMLVIAFGLEGGVENPSFDDVSESDWHYPYITSAFKNGAVKGVTEKSFGVGNHITRQDMAVMIYRVIKESDKNLENSDRLDFKDNDEISEYAKDAVAYLKAAGVISGMEDGTFSPKAESTRAQAACVIYRAMEFIGDIEGGV